MVKRLFWLVVGAAFGFGMSFWVTRAVRGKVARLSPDHVSAELAKSVRALGADLRAAVSEGVAGMRDREVELRDAVERNRSNG
ncbi:MAG TPA: hypothetical protein VHM89_15040 [Acidimicrobiales bacterium]|nr:hypothetical protein [Acidimicrobiales bacterium]